MTSPENTHFIVEITGAAGQDLYLQECNDDSPAWGDMETAKVFADVPPVWTHGLKPLADVIRFRKVALVPSSVAVGTRVYWDLVRDHRWQRNKAAYLKAIAGDLEQQKNVSQSVDVLGLSIRAKRAVENYGIKTLCDLITFPGYLNELKNVGVTTVSEIKQKLSTQGLAMMQEVRHA
jgi:hypothetical protein